ncbi:MAG: DMT family transporter [Bacillota bacterium]
MQEKQFGLIDMMLIGCAVIWGVNVVAIKLALLQLSPLAFNSLRFIGAASLSWIVLLWREPGARLDKRDLPKLIWLGILGHTLYQVLFITGTSLTTAGNTSLLLATIPLWVSVLSGLFGLEQVRVQTWLGLACSFSGILLVTVGGGKQISFGQMTARGDLMVLVGALMNAYFTISSKPLLKRYSPLQFNAYTMTAGAIGLLIFSNQTLRAQDWSVVGAYGWGGLAFSTVLAIVLGNVIWNSGIKKIGASRTAVYNNLQPAVAMLASWLILAENIRLPQILGACAIIGGLYITKMTGLPWEKKATATKEA